MLMMMLDVMMYVHNIIITPNITGLRLIKILRQKKYEAVVKKHSYCNCHNVTPIELNVTKSRSSPISSHCYYSLIILLGKIAAFPKKSNRL